MANLRTRLLLLISSYFPLSWIFFCLNYKVHYWISVAVVLISTLGLIWLWQFLRAVQRITPVSLHVAQVVRRDSDTLTYLGTYILPFLGLTFDSIGQIIGLALLASVIAVIYVNSNLIHVNPMLYCFKYKVVAITEDDGTECVVITKRRVKRNETLNVIDIGDEIFVEKEK